MFNVINIKANYLQEFRHSYDFIVNFMLKVI